MAFSQNFRQPIPSSSLYNYPGGVTAPALPPRNYGATNAGAYGGTSMPNYNGFGGSMGLGNYGFGGSGFGSYGGYGTPSYFGYGSNYGSYSGYGSGYGYGSSNNAFIQIAENSARPAFDSFRSVMGMLQSVTMMFDSTFNAIHASYASVLGVADNFSRLRSMFAKVFSAFSAIKALNWLYRKLLRLFGRSYDDQSLGAAWSAIVTEGVQGAAAADSPRSWPAVALIGLLIAGPYFIMKLISQIVPESPAVWNPVVAKGLLTQVLYDFNPGAQAELGIRRGQKIMVAPRQFQIGSQDWILACDQQGKIGLVPANYIQSVADIATTSVSAQPMSNSSPLSQTFTNILPQTSKSSDQHVTSTMSHPNLAQNTFPVIDSSASCSSAEASFKPSQITDVTQTLAEDAEVNIPPIAVGDS